MPRLRTARRVRPVLALLCVPCLAAGCATAPSSRPGPAAAIPVFAAGDSRVSTPGFVAQTLRLGKDVGAERYTLMAFVVGDTLTLGAMVKGTFRGTVNWTVGGRALTMPFTSTEPGATTRAVVSGAEEGTLPAQGAAFRGTAWVNVEVPLSDWLEDGTPLVLAFRPESGAPIVLPDAGQHYVAQLEAR